MSEVWVAPRGNDRRLDTTHRYNMHTHTGIYINTDIHSKTVTTAGPNNMFALYFWVSPWRSLGHVLLKYTHTHTYTYTYTDIDTQTHTQAYMYISTYDSVSASTISTLYDNAFPRHRQPCHLLFSSSTCTTINQNHLPVITNLTFHNFTPILLPHFTSSPHTLPSDLSNTFPNQMQPHCSTPGAIPSPHSSRENPNSSAPPRALSRRGGSGPSNWANHATTSYSPLNN